MVATWNIARGLNRLFVVFAIGWYILGGLVAWPRWTNTIRHRREAQHIFAGTPNPNPDGTITVYPDEIDGYQPAQQKINGLSPRRYRAWQAALREADDERALPLTIFFLAVPVVVYAFGVSLYWAARGFRQES
jgi:hypothetical protein